MILVLPIAFQLHHEAWASAFVLIFIAGVSDALDGFLARIYHWQSQLGSILDPLADKLLLIVILIILANKGVVPYWLLALVVGRDAVILVGAIIYRWLTKDLTISPLLSSKVNTALQIFFVLTLMFHLSIMALPESLITGLEIGVAITTLLSGFLYVKCWASYTMMFVQKKTST